MSQPTGFSWINKPLLAALAEPVEAEEFHWLREHGLQLLISLTEEPPRRDWINDAGLLSMHVPVPDMHPPTPAQIDLILSAIRRAHQHNLGVGIHCAGGMGRTGVVLACYFVTEGMSANNAVARVRRLRPGSIETDEQVEAVSAFEKRLHAKEHG
jgi:atypical dual specificity phosphatase